MPRPRSLTLDQIAAAALAVLDRDGQPGFSMRAVAKELRVGTMSLYRYVADRDEVEILVGGLVLGAVDLDTTGPPRERVTTLVERARTAVAAHSATIPLLISHRQQIPGSLEWGEAVITAYAAAGLDPVERALALRATIAYLFGALQLATGAPLAGPGTQRIASGDLPHIAESARAAGDVDPGVEFRRGLDALLDGLGLRS